MPWEILIIPLIAFGAWILSTIFKDNEADKNKAPRRLDGTRAPRRPTQLDAFLDESRRRRDMPPEMQTRQEPPKPAPPPAPAPVQRRPTPGPRPAPPRRNVPVLATIIEEPPPKPDVRRAAVVEKAPPPVPVPTPAPPAPGTPTALPAPPPAPVLRRERPPTPVLRDVVRMLRGPRTAAAAVVLREVLDRPLCMRRR
jgi:hypothetical protein